MYEFCCPACNSKYIGKTDWNFGTRVQEHGGLDKTSLVYNHLLECGLFNYVVNLHSLPPSYSLVEYLENVKIAVYDNTKIIDNSQNWIELFFSKAFTSNGRNQNWIVALKLPKNLFYFHDVINILIVAYSLDYTVFNSLLILLNTVCIRNILFLRSWFYK